MSQARTKGASLGAPQDEEQIASVLSINANSKQKVFNKVVRSYVCDHYGRRQESY